MHQTDLSEGLSSMPGWSSNRTPDCGYDQGTEGFGPIGGLPLEFGCVVAVETQLRFDATCLPYDRYRD